MIIAAHGRQSRLKTTVGRDIKGRISPALYLIATGAAFFQEWVAATIEASVAVMRLVPDRRIERLLQSQRS